MPQLLPRGIRFYLGIFLCGLGLLSSSSLLAQTFSSDPFWGDRNNYTERVPNNWSVGTDQGDTRYLLSTAPATVLAPVGSAVILGDYAFGSDSAYSDFTFNLQARSPQALNNPNAEFALVFGYQDEDNYTYLRLSPSPNSTNFFQVENGQRFFVGGTFAPITIPDSNYHQYQLVRTGTTVTLFLDGNQILQATFNRLGAPGGIGFGSQNETAGFDNVTVQGTIFAPIFSPIPYFGVASNYENRDASNWAIGSDKGDTRYFLLSDLPGKQAPAGGGKILTEYAAALDSNYQDFALTVDVRAPKVGVAGGEDFGIVFGYQDSSNYLFLRVSANTNATSFFKVENDARSFVGGALANGAISDSNYHTYQLIRSSDTATLYVNGNQTYQVVLAGVTQAGRVGFGVMDNAVFFDNFNVAGSPVSGSPTVFSPISYFGDRLNYMERTPSRWTTGFDQGEVRYHLVQNYPSYQAPAGGGKTLTEFSIIKDSLYEDFEFTLKVRAPDAVTQGGEDFALVFGFEDSLNYNFVRLSNQPNATNFFRMDNGFRSFVGGSVAAVTIADSLYHDLKLTRSADTVRLYIDGNFIHERVLPALERIGGIGIGTLDDQAFFDDLNVSGITIPPPTPIFSPDPYFGNRENYQERDSLNWNVIDDQGDLRYVIPNNPPNYQAPGGGGLILSEFAVALDSIYGDFSLSVDARLDKAVSDPTVLFGLIFGYQDSLNYHLLRISGQPGVTNFFDVQNGSRNFVGAGYPNAVITDSLYHTYLLERQGSTLSLSQDGNQLFSLTLPPLSNPGRIGFGTFNDAVAFDNVSVGGQALVPAPVVFASDPVLGTRDSYEELSAPNWSVVEDLGDLRYAIPAAVPNRIDTAGVSILGEYSYLRDSSYQDFTFSVQARSKVAGNPNADFALVFGYQDDLNYNYLRLSANTNATFYFEVDNGGRSFIGGGNSPASLTDTNYHTYTLVRDSQTVMLFIDGVEIYTESLPALMRVGSIGFGTINDPVLFDNPSIVNQAIVPAPQVFSPVPFFGNAGNYSYRQPANWSVEFDQGDERLVLLNDQPVNPAPGGGGNILSEFAVATDSLYDDFTMTLKAKTPNAATDPNADYALVFGYEDSLNYNYLRLSAKTDATTFFRVINGVRSFIGGNHPGITIADTGYHELQLIRQGQTALLMVDGQPIYQLSLFAIARTGRVGVGSPNDRCAFDDLTVSRTAVIPESPVFSPVPYYGNRNNYLEREVSNWETGQDQGDIRYLIPNNVPTVTAPVGGGLILGEYSIGKDSAYQDFTMSMIARSPNAGGASNADIGMVFGYINEDNYAYLRISPISGNTRFIQVKNGERFSIDPPLSTAAMADDAYHHYRLLRSGQQLFLYVDSVLTFEADDVGLSNNGRIGVGTVSGRVFFDDIALSRSVVIPGQEVFSPVPFFGDAANYDRRDPNNWEVDFDQGDARLLIRTAPSPGIAPVGGQLILGDYSIAKDSVYQDFTLLVQARSFDALTNLNADFALVYGYQDENNYSYILLSASPNATRIFKVKNGARSIIGNAFAPVTIPDENYHAYRLLRDGQELSLYLDNVLLLQANDPEIVEEGRVGVGTLNDKAFFDNLDLSRELITDLPGELERRISLRGWVDASQGVVYFTPIEEIGGNIRWRMSLLDMQGRTVEHLEGLGSELRWDYRARGISTGVYLYRATLESNGQTFRYQGKLWLPN